MSLGKPIAYGRTAEVYPWEEGRIIKLFHPTFPAQAVRYEAQLARAVHRAGLPVPAVGRVLQVDGRWGLTYERVDGPSMLEELRSRPWKLIRSARLLAELQARMHATKLEVDLPSQQERLREKIGQAPGLGPDLRETLLEALGKLAPGDRLCHGDFHPDNVLITGRGPVVIDWIDASLGNPLADLARTSVILRGVGASGKGSWAQKMLLKWYHQLYLRRYFDLRGGEGQEYRAWYPIVAAARLSEGIENLEEWLRAEAETGRKGNRRQS